MGWQQQRERAKQFQQQTDAALANDILQDNLLSRTRVVRRRSYACICEPNTTAPGVGTEVRIIDMRDRIDIYEANRAVGQVVPAQTELMRRQEHFAERQGRSVFGRVTKVSKVANGFSVEVTDQ
jgi:hypothetical protein